MMVVRGEKIKELRAKCGYSRKELADKICVSVSELQSWEEGWFLICPSSGEIEEMADAFDMDEKELRKIIHQDWDDDSDENTELRFIDFVDSAIRLRKYVKNQSK